MDKKEIKYVLSYSILISILIFVIMIGANELVDVLGSSLLINAILWYLAALIAAILIVLAFTQFSSVVTDAMMTLRRKLRFESLSNPLLMRLSYEAPGTYHHSLIVSNLARRACKTINADSLLARVAAYYHDIGKLEDPNKFIENQAHNEIPKEEGASSIKRDAKAIISHVANGLKIAKEHNLPEDITDIIAEHHGTTRVQYYYERAKEKGLKVKYTDFRYPGPTPQSKESAITMLADCVEATTRAQEYLNDSIIEKIVGDAIEDKLSKGQLSSVNFTESELAKIRTSMIETLSSVYHQRISYTNGKS